MCSGSSTAPTGTTTTTYPRTTYTRTGYIGYRSPTYTRYPLRTAATTTGTGGLAIDAEPVAPPSPYAGNYGYGATAPTYSEAERQWYIDNGYGDPLAMSNGYYQGVTQDGRSAYLSAADYANQVAEASKRYSSGMVAASDGRAVGSGVTYTYAGDALGIPKA